MAGSLPDVPGYRFAYDVDGTIGVNYSPTLEGPITTLTNDWMSVMNSNADLAALIGTGSQYWAYIFPEPRTISGYFIRSSSNSIINGHAIATSNNTINGRDGDWMVRENPYIYIDYTSNISPHYRQSIQLVDWQDVRAVRIANNGVRPTIHLYGLIDPSESPDRLRIVDLSDDDIAAQLDFGDIYQRSNVTKQFKVINNSSTQTANNITVGLNTQGDATPTLVGQFQISTDNVAYANAVNIGDLAPGASSGTLYVRDTVASNAQLGPWTARITASAVSWS